MIRTLDTHEQKSPLYIKEKFPETIITPMKVCDYTHYEWVGQNQLPSWWNPTSELEINSKMEIKKGIGIELKHDDFVLKSNDTIEQFKKELSQMVEWGCKNPLIHLHAIWRKDNIWHNPWIWIEKFQEMRNQIAVFFSICQDFGIKGHVVETDEQVIKLLKRLPHEETAQTYIKRSHEEPTILAKMLRQFPGISSEKAIECANILHEWSAGKYGEEMLNSFWEWRQHITNLIGVKKDGKPRKLAKKIIHWLETGEEP